MSATEASLARQEAVRQLQRIEKDQAYVSLVDRRQKLTKRDERFVTELVAGITRWRRWLDFLIGEFYHGSVQKLDPEVHQVLRIGFYELLFLRTPTYAAVNEAVELAKAVSHQGVVGLVNGVLRAVERKRDQLPEPSADDPAVALAIRYSHPDWLVQRWVERFGPAETEKLLTINNERPSYALRINRLKTNPKEFLARLEEAGVETQRSDFFNDFVVVNQIQEVLEAGLLEEGLCTVQGQGAGAVVQLTDPQPGEFIIDLCSAPGGKTFYLAELMQNQGSILAADVHDKRLKLLDQTAKRLGISIVSSQAVDGRKLADQEDIAPADRVLVDVPCSGTGVLSKRADLRWQRRPEDLTDLTKLQDELLGAAAQLVKPGGVLIYSTCSIEPEENEQRVQAFLAQHNEFYLEDAHPWIPEELLNANGQLSVLPHKHRMDGAFAARLRRKKEA